MINEEQRSALKSLILEEIADTEESVQRLAERLKPIGPDRAVDSLSRLDAISQAGTATIAMTNARRRLERLRSRLARLADPRFDRCDACGDEIDIERIEAVPESGHCPACARGGAMR